MRCILKLASLDAQLQQLKAQAKGKQVAVSEPVFDYALVEMGYKVANQHFAKAIEDGTDPSPKDITTMRDLPKPIRLPLVINKQEESPILNKCTN